MTATPATGCSSARWPPTWPLGSRAGSPRRGAAAYLTHGPERCPTDLERAQFANETDADLLVSLHCDGHATAGPSGVAVYYFGTGPDNGSVPGERLAGLIQREVVARCGFDDARTHPTTWELLRRTRMPARPRGAGVSQQPG